MNTTIENSKKGWNRAWKFFFGLEKTMVIMIIIFFFSAGFFTWYGIKYNNAIELNRLLQPLFDNFRLESIFIYDAIIGVILIMTYKAENALKRRAPRLKNYTSYVFMLFFMLLYIFTFLNFLNDFGVAMDIKIFQNTMQILKVTDIYKIIGGS